MMTIMIESEGARVEIDFRNKKSLPEFLPIPYRMPIYIKCLADGVLVSNPQ